MRAGRLRERVDVRKRTTTLDQYGGDVATWTVVATVWAGVEPVSSVETATPPGLRRETLTRFVLRYDDGLSIDSTCQLVHNGLPYDIAPPLNEGMRNRQWTILGSQGAERS